MPTDNTSKPLHEELQLLSNAVEGDTFHFVIAQWHHFSLIQITKDYLRQQYPERSALSLRVEGQTYDSLTEQIYSLSTGFVFIEDFENILNAPQLYVAFNQRRGKIAQQAVCLLCFIPPGEEYVKKCSERLPDWWSVLTFFAELAAPEYVKPGVSPSFQEPKFTSMLGGLGQEERITELQRLLARIASVKINAENAKLFDKLYGQALEVCQTAGLYQRGLETANEWLKIAFALDYERIAPSSFSSILNWIGTFEEHLGNYDRAARLMEKSLKISLEHFGPKHPNIAINQSNLAAVYSNLGQYQKARDLLEAAIESDLSDFGPDHPKVAVRKSNLANVYGEIGQYEKARELLQTALESDLKNFGPDHPKVAVSQLNLANAYSHLGQYEKARDLLEMALKSDLKNFGLEHPTVTESKSNLAIIYTNLGQYEKAIVLLIEALNSDLKNFGPHHPKVAIRKSNLANVYYDLKQYEKALVLLQEALDSDLKNFGPEHPKVAIDQYNIGVVFAATGEKDKANACFQQAYDLLKKHFGEQHPNTQKAKKRLDIL